MESVLDVRARVADLLADLTRDGSLAGPAGRVLLVLHGDIGQILETLVRGIDPGLHRDLPPLQPAEVRPIPSSTRAV